ncbi:HAO1 [Branchiostoma lanceolatum]|uniref:HAO1 protein n=1 Tax=Branchiostoma lanceolatum TaxID=7740 RepID=A0A8J9Z4F5_BRALA|nr:HAO1 [Branchiostoma lanceolatum]
MSENVHPKATSVAEFEKAANEKLSEFVRTYYSHPGEGGQTYRDNCRAFKRYRLIPRNLRDVYIRDTSVTVLGSKLDFPVAIAPTAVHKFAHPDAEAATAKGAASMDTAMVLSSWSLLMMRGLHEHSDGPELLVTLLMMYVSLFHPPGAASMNTAMVLSSWSHCSLEQVAAAAPRGVRWFYMLFYRDRGRMKRLLERAERAGYTAIVLTVDSPIYPFSLRKSPVVFPVQFRLPNVWLDDDVVPGSPGSLEQGSALTKITKNAATWDDVKWVKNNTRLPVIDVLPDIVRAVGGEAEVYLDGGVRTGTDVLKALALGVRCVFIGRPALWGLACNGAEGVQQVLQILKEEFSLAMARAGCAKLSDIQPSLIVHESYYLNRQMFNIAGNVNNKILKSKY